MTHNRMLIALFALTFTFALGCNGGSPTAPAFEPETAPLTADAKGGGGANKEQGTFQLDFQGDLVGSGTGRSSLSKITLPGFELDVAKFLASQDDGVNNFAKCFGSGQNYHGTLVVANSRKNPTELDIKYDFAALQVDGVTPIAYKIAITAEMQAGVWPPGVVAPARAASGTYALRGYKGRASCGGSGNLSFVLDATRLD